MEPLGTSGGRELDPERPPEAPDQALAAALLPVLLHRIRNTTQLLTAVNAVLAPGAGPDALGDAQPSPARAEDLAQASRQADELGWLLGVLSGGLGADLAGGRLEPGGLRVTLELVRDALRRDGPGLAFGGGPWPELSSAAPGAALCLAAAGLVWRTGRGAEGAELGLERGEGGWQLWMRGASTPALGEALAGLPEVRLVVGPSDWVLDLPAAWLSPT